MSDSQVELPLSELRRPDLKTAVNEIENAVYAAASYMERLENMGLVTGNGHHAAQKIAKFASDQVRDRWNFGDDSVDPDAGADK